MASSPNNLFIPRSTNESVALHAFIACMCLQLTKKWHQSKPLIGGLAAQLQQIAESSELSRKLMSSSVPLATSGQGVSQPMASSPTKSHPKSHAQVLKQGPPASRRQATAAQAPPQAQQQPLKHLSPGEEAAEELQKLLEGIREPARKAMALLSDMKGHVQWPFIAEQDPAINHQGTLARFPCAIILS
jgi:hypothetical protein